MGYKWIGELEENKKYFLLTNEAIARAALEAGIDVAATFPGTPSSEIGDVLFDLHEKTGMYFEFSVNEKVAFEIAMAAAVSNLKALTFMKHVGVNVAMDSLMSSAYIGVDGSLVIISADDPSMYSSQNEQDNRYIARFAHLPMFEPSSPQESMDMLKSAIDFSHLYHLPVLFRTTTRVAHVRGVITANKLNNANLKGNFVKDPSRRIPLPQFALKMKSNLLDKMEKVKQSDFIKKWNIIEKINGGGDIAFVTSGASYNYLYDALKKYNLSADILKMGFTYPLNEEFLSSFMSNHKEVFVVEEVDPVLEHDLRAIAQKHKIGIDIHGKEDLWFEMPFENTPDRIANLLEKIFGIKRRIEMFDFNNLPIPSRPPAMCPGCPHRESFYIIKNGLRQKGLYGKAIVPTDIGCYTLGVQEPYSLGDILLSMGSSIGTSNGFSIFMDVPIVPIVGDSTFFHAAIPGIINAVHNNHDVLYVILNNRSTAMTGNQDSPVLGEDFAPGHVPVDIASVLKGIGVNEVHTLDPVNIKEGIAVFKEMISKKGVRAIIFERECALITDKREHDLGKTHLYEVDQNKCIHCMNCVERFACPALSKEGTLVQINPYLCDGCGACAEPIVCAPKAIIKVM